LAGELPFGGTSLQEKYLGTTSGARASLANARPDLPRAIDDWAATALALDREQRFGNVRALWSAFLGVLQLKAPSARPPSFWAAAKGAVGRLVGGSQPAPGASAANGVSAEPSFSALAQSALHLPPEPTPTPAEPPPADERRFPAPPTKLARPAEATIELRDADLLRGAPPPRRPPPRKPPPPRPVEKTLETSEADFVEQTLDDVATPPDDPPA
jgi:hypothetical protein